jgi:hypothetical protein
VKSHAPAIFVVAILVLALVAVIWQARRARRHESVRDRIIAESIAAPCRPPAAPDNEPGVNLADLDECGLILRATKLAGHDRHPAAIHDEQQKGD